ncbi:hypothetical protein RB595_004930 [Gaeumannomyces hyphopodioides]
MEEIDAHLRGLFASWQACKNHDDQKNAVIEALFAHAGSLKNSLEQAYSAIREQRLIAIYYHQELNNVKSLDMSLAQPEPRSFVKILVDGNRMLFKDELVMAGFTGGRHAAHSLKEAGRRLLASPADGDNEPHPEVMVRVHASLKSLLQVYRGAGNTDFPLDSVHGFVRGFNSLGLSCDFANADDIGEELADERVRAELRFILHQHAHCQQIFVGGAADDGDGYARLLQEYAGQSDAVRGRIALIRGPQFAPGLAALVEDKFRVVAMEEIFR